MASEGALRLVERSGLGGTVTRVLIVSSPSWKSWSCQRTARQKVPPVSKLHVPDTGHTIAWVNVYGPSAKRFVEAFLTSPTQDSLACGKCFSTDIPAAGSRAHHKILQSCSSFWVCHRCALLSRLPRSALSTDSRSGSYIITIGMCRRMTIECCII